MCVCVSVFLVSLPFHPSHDKYIKDSVKSTRDRDQKHACASAPCYVRNGMQQREPGHVVQNINTCISLTHKIAAVCCSVGDRDSPVKHLPHSMLLTRRTGLTRKTPPSIIVRLSRLLSRPSVVNQFVSHSSRCPRHPCTPISLGPSW